MLILFAPVRSGPPVRRRRGDQCGGTPAAVTPARSDPRTAGPTRCEGSGPELRRRQNILHPGTGAHYQRADLGEVRSLAGRRHDWGFPPLTRVLGALRTAATTTSAPPTNPVIFWTPTRPHGWFAAPNTRGTNWAARGSARRADRGRDVRGRGVTQKFTGGEVSYDTKAKTFNTVHPSGRAAVGLEYRNDPTSAINAAGARRGALGRSVPRGGRRIRSGATARANFAGQDLLQPGHRANVSRRLASTKRTRARWSWGRLASRRPARSTAPRHREPT